MHDSGSSSLRSMTGHGLGEAALGPGRVQIEIRSVNHRYLEVRVRLPTELLEHSSFVEEQVRNLLGRGRIEVTGRLSGDALGAPVLDVARARTAYEQLLALRDALSPREPLPLSLLSSVPDLFVARGLPDLRAARDGLARAIEQACRGVAEMRAREGAALAADLGHRVERLVEHVAQIEERVPETVESARRRLQERIEKLLLQSGALPIDEGRLEQEIAVFADRCDVTEECTRLRSHADQFRTLLAGDSPEALGRRLDFLLQEMAREANTIGAKSADSDIAHLVVELKADVERMREQVQNVL
ncbi:MAG: YicC family protein [Myxococcota bacterium]|nr:YicC family protein [Myxococcota bacterium]